MSLCCSDLSSQLMDECHQECNIWLFIIDNPLFLAIYMGYCSMNLYILELPYYPVWNGVIMRKLMEESISMCSVKEGTLNWEMLQFKSKFPRQVLLCRVSNSYAISWEFSIGALMNLVWRKHDYLLGIMCF